MDQFIQFLMNHWILSTAFIIVTCLLFALEFINNLRGIRQLTPQEVTQAINHQGATVIDIRTAEQFKQGHIIGSLNIPFIEFDKQHKLQNQQSLIIVCENGQNSGTIAASLKKQGFTQVSCLKGGITTWKESQLPLVKK